jgi:4-amino-4-deoxy-L-arabinose transferase-like glycosyltransferase
MFRFNNPDALLTLLALGAYATVRATERGRTAWLVMAATCVGLGFLTKLLQALLVVPAFALVYLAAAPVSLRRRVGQLLAAGAACWSRRAGGWRSSSSSRPPTGPTSGGRRTTACST